MAKKRDNDGDADDRKGGVKQRQHRNLHAPTSGHAMDIYKESIGQKGGNHLISPDDNFDTPAGGYGRRR